VGSGTNRSPDPQAASLAITVWREGDHGEQLRARVILVDDLEEGHAERLHLAAESDILDAVASWLRRFGVPGEQASRG